MRGPARHPWPGRTGRAGKKGKAVSLVSSEERHRLADIQKLIKLEIRQEIIAGYDPEPDFFDGDAGKRRRSPAPASAGRSDERPAPDRKKRSERESSRDTRERPAPRSRQPSHIASDGFDFNKPYEQREMAGPAPDAAEAAIAPTQKSQRPIAFLLGGLGLYSVTQAFTPSPLLSLALAAGWGLALGLFLFCTTLGVSLRSMGRLTAQTQSARGNNSHNG